MTPTIQTMPLAPMAITRLNDDQFQVVQATAEITYSLVELHRYLELLQADNVEIRRIRVWRDTLPVDLQKYVTDRPDNDTSTIESLIEALESYGDSI